MTDPFPARAVARLPPGRAAARAWLGAVDAPMRDHEPDAMPPGPLAGDIGQADHDGVGGWAIDTSQPDAPVALEILADGVVIARCVADQQRADLERAGLGSGRCGFARRFAVPLRRDRSVVLRIRRARDEADLPGSPLLLAGLAVSPGALLDRLEAETADDPARREERATGLAQSIGRLVQALVAQRAAGSADAARAQTVDPTREEGRQD